MRTTISERSVFSPACLIAVCVSAGIHVAALVGLIILALLPYFTVPVLIEVYGDSDREGFPDIDAVTLAPGTYRRGNEHTPGGDGQPQAKPSEPEGEPEPPEPADPSVSPPESEKTADPATTKPTSTAEPKTPVPSTSSNQPAGPPAPPPPAPRTNPLPSAQRPIEGGSRSPDASLPGAPGGSPLPPGTPSSGGRVGSRNGVREARGARPPVYPRAAREAGIEGTVVIWLRVSAEGAVLEAKVHKSSGHAVLDDAALLWARKQKFIPARVGSTPVVAEVTKPVHFYLY